MRRKKIFGLLVSKMPRFLQNVLLACVILTFLAMYLFNLAQRSQNLIQSDLNRTFNKESSSVTTTRKPSHTTTHNLILRDLNRTSNKEIRTIIKSGGKLVFPHLPYIRNPSKICDTFRTLNRTKLLVLVKSSPDNFHLRNWIRFQNQQDNEFKDSIKTVFLLGESSSSEENIKKESQKFGDIVQGSFMDTYRNLTYKTVMGYRWLSEHCSHADFVLYKDDDFKINRKNIMHKLKSPKNPDSLFAGFLVKNGKGIYRDPKHKWYLSKKDYPKDILPPYFPGGAYIVSTVIAKKLASNFHLVKRIPIDDVYIGLVAQTLNITLTHSKLFGMGDCKHYKIHLACREFTRPNDVLAAWKSLTMFNLERRKS